MNKPLAKNAIAFFDLDRTLIANNSAFALLWQEIKIGHVGMSEFLGGLLWLIRYSFGGTNLATAATTLVKAIKGHSEQKLQERMTDFYLKYMRPCLRPGAYAVLRMHRENGDRLVLLTSSSKYLSQLIVKDLELDDYLCTELEIGADGLFTGNVIGYPCFGDGKLIAARNYANEVKVDLQECTFYTDSASDMPVLEAVGYPVAVNPDIRLRRIAKVKHWPIVDWGKPAK
ncbi:MAG: HAD family hydrolase [Deltaproteobacteria bacterium]|nr:HAD family hydrolase [Deltaproteobacteria bacterium]